MPLSVEQTLRKAKSHARKGEVELAVQKFQRVLEQYPKNKQAIEGLKALQQPTAATKPAAFRKKIDELTALYNQGKLQETLVQGEALAKQFPNDPITANLLGVVHFGLGHADKAIASYSAALRSKPHFAEAHNNLGDVLNSLGKPEEAATSYRAALQIRPGFAEQ